MSDYAELNIEGNSYKLPIIEGTEQEKGLDISKLRASSGYITVDTGFKKLCIATIELTFSRCKII